MAQLDACPLCRSVVDPGVRTCPSCGADLSPYLELLGRTEYYAGLALELLARGQTAEARSIITHLEQLAELPEARRSELAARLALAEGDLTAALQHARSCQAEAAEAIEDEVRVRLGGQRRARELYNRALYEARQGASGVAAELLQQAVTAEPDLAAAWQLKLKVDLLSGDFRRCYADLQALDRLAARPPQFAGLERLLPPLTS